MSTDNKALAAELGERADAVVVASATGSESILLAEVNKLIGCARGTAAALREPSTLLSIEPGERLFQFDSKQDWINHAQAIWRRHGVRGADTICVDQRGRLVGWGKHFMDAERDDAYPIVVYRLRADMNSTAAQQAGES